MLIHNPSPSAALRRQLVADLTSFLRSVLSPQSLYAGEVVEAGLRHCLPRPMNMVVFAPACAQPGEVVGAGSWHGIPVPAHKHIASMFSGTAYSPKFKMPHDVDQSRHLVHHGEVVGAGFSERLLGARPGP